MGKDRPAITLDYRALASGPPDPRERGELLAAAGHQAAASEINQNIDQISVERMPSVHAMLHNAYAVIDVELRRLGRVAQMEGLSKTETTQFERYATAMVKLVGLEHDIRDNSEVDAMSDDALETAVVSQIMGKLPKGGSGAR